MAKRYFDSGKFDDPFYRKLSPEMKCAYDYLQSKCDYAGVINIDIDDVNFKVGCNNITLAMIKEEFANKFIILDENDNGLKIFLPKFIFWQYQNRLIPSNKVHRHVFEILTREGIAAEQFFAPYVLIEDFYNWETLSKMLKSIKKQYKDWILEERS